MKKIVMTGGGTAGHVTPNIALMPSLKNNGYDITYIGSYSGMEKDLIEKFGIPYHGISSGRLRRYFSIKNISDMFRVIKGLWEALGLMKKLRPNVVFSKGGFVTVPVVLAAKVCGIPTIIHESDITPGLANRIALVAAKKVCCNFPETVSYIPDQKGVFTGTPIRKELFQGMPEKAVKHCGFPDHSKPVLLIVGGSTGARSINCAIRKNLSSLLEDFHIIHLCGKGNLDPSLTHVSGYAQFEYAHEELADMYALADLVVSRAGANLINEFAALAKPNILIPLPRSQSRGDQILNAKSFVKQGFSVMIEEEELTDQLLLDTIHDTYKNRETYISAMKKIRLADSEKLILDLIDSVFE